MSYDKSEIKDAVDMVSARLGIPLSCDTLLFAELTMEEASKLGISQGILLDAIQSIRRVDKSYSSKLCPADVRTAAIRRMSYLMLEARSFHARIETGGALALGHLKPVLDAAQKGGHSRSAELLGLLSRMSAGFEELVEFVEGTVSLQEEMRRPLPAATMLWPDGCEHQHPIASTPVLSTSEYRTSLAILESPGRGLTVREELVPTVVGRNRRSGQEMVEMRQRYVCESNASLALLDGLPALEGHRKNLLTQGA